MFLLISLILCLVLFFITRVNHNKCVRAYNDFLNSDSYPDNELESKYKFYCRSTKICTIISGGICILLVVVNMGHDFSWW